MNIDKLKAAEREFLALYPDGFEDEALATIRKRHTMDKHHQFALDNLGPHSGSNVDKTLANIVLLVSRSSMVSFFEKPKFKDLIGRLDAPQRAYFVDSMLALIHAGADNPQGQQEGFEGVVDVLRLEKLARWSLTTIVPSYYAPDQAVFVKPTTAKGIIKALEIRDLVYKPQPSWAFYQGYKTLIEELKAKVNPKLSPSNPAFTGFLMMTLLRQLAVLRLQF